MKVKSHLHSLKLPNLRLYQQIIICFIAVVLIPLLGVTIIIYSINQTALKKELTTFTESTAQGVYKELLNEMTWEQNDVHLLGSFLLERAGASTAAFNPDNFKAAAGRIFTWSPECESLAIYDANRHLIQDAYRNYAQVSPEMRLPLELDELDIREPYQVLYNNLETPEYASYYLRAVIPVKNGGRIAYYALQKKFQFLKNLIRENTRTLYNGVYVIDNKGLIIAGPSSSVSETHFISTQDFERFRKLKPGVTQVLSSTQPTVDLSPLGLNSSGENEKDDAPPLEKVFVKIPNIEWGLIIESPYHVRQKYVKRARNQSLALILICLSIVSFLGLFYILSISRNFRQLMKGIKAMGEGNYSRRIRLITNSMTPYEIIYLAGEFNRMCRKMADAWHQSQQLNRELREANAKLSKLDELKSNLIDTVSHELRTPLTSIKGYTSRLIRYDGTLDPGTRLSSLRTIKQQADRLGRLVEDLLVIPDLEHHSIRVFPDQVPLSDLLAEFVAFIQHKEHREITVHFAQKEMKALADHDRLGQVVLNLLDNAVKYSKPDTPIRVFVAYDSGWEEPVTSMHESDLSMIRIRIENQSESIAPEMLDSLFEKFKRLDESTTRTTRGSGLGLFITKGLVEAMGGKIVLDCQAECFIVHFWIPAYRESTLIPA